MELLTINQPSLLEISGGDMGETAYGGDQDWYGTRMMRAGGCGPTAASNLLAYAAQKGGEASALCRSAKPPFSKQAFLDHMNDVGRFIYPGFMGTPQFRFVRGLAEYIKNQNVEPDIRELAFSTFRSKRAPLEQMLRFIREALEADSPLAWLNRSNGKKNEVESWHWVNIVALGDAEATVFDAGTKRAVDIIDWHRTSLHGGALVYINIGK